MKKNMTFVEKLKTDPNFLLQSSRHLCPICAKKMSGHYSYCPRRCKCEWEDIDEGDTTIQAYKCGCTWVEEQQKTWCDNCPKKYGN